MIKVFINLVTYFGYHFDGKICRQINLQISGVLQYINALYCTLSGQDSFPQLSNLVSIN